MRMFYIESGVLSVLSLLFKTMVSTCIKTCTCIIYQYREVMFEGDAPEDS
jgi:hypothetical protein